MNISISDTNYTSALLRNSVGGSITISQSLPMTSERQDKFLADLAKLMVENHIYKIDVSLNPFSKYFYENPAGGAIY